jgi:hypothetical protein
MTESSLEMMEGGGGKRKIAEVICAGMNKEATNESSIQLVTFLPPSGFLDE